MNFPELISIMLQSFDWLRSKTMWNCEIKFYWISITFGAITDSLIPFTFFFRVKSEWMNECKRKKTRAHSKKYHHTQIKLKACHKKMKPLFLILKPIITGFKSYTYDTIYMYFVDVGNVNQLYPRTWLPNNKHLFDSHIHSYDA